MNRLTFIVFGSLMAIFGILMIVYVCFNFSFTVHNSANQKKHRVILIVLDALRHDYLEIAKAKNVSLTNLNKMATNGARSMQAVPAYPSVTFPNHQTLVTGLYTPYHGVTHNNFNDSSMAYDQFSMDNQTSLNEARWYRGYADPIWVSCEKNAHCKSGSMLWPHTDAVISGHRPFRFVSEYTALNQRPNVVYPFDRRIDELVNWITADLIDFGLLYFDEPDATSHEFGPTDEKTLKKLNEMDGYIGRLIDTLEKADLLPLTDIILTGDHGMTDMSVDRVINIDQFVPPSLYKSSYSFPVGIIYPNEGKFDEVFKLYSNASEHIKVYKRENLPEELHYTDNERRISPIVTVVDLGWFVNCSHYKKDFIKGNHGYVSSSSDMKAMLLAMGPSFRQHVLPETRHVDLYPLMMHLLGLRANVHNGSFDRISSFLTKDARTWTPIEEKWRHNSLVICAFVMLLCQVLLSLLFVVANVLEVLRGRSLLQSFALSDKNRYSQ